MKYFKLLIFMGGIFGCDSESKKELDSIARNFITELKNQKTVKNLTSWLKSHKNDIKDDKFDSISEQFISIIKSNGDLEKTGTEKDYDLTQAHNDLKYVIDSEILKNLFKRIFLKNKDLLTKDLATMVDINYEDFKKNDLITTSTKAILNLVLSISNFNNEKNLYIVDINDTNNAKFSYKSSVMDMKSLKSFLEGNIFLAIRDNKLILIHKKDKNATFEKYKETGRIELDEKQIDVNLSYDTKTIKEITGLEIKKNTNTDQDDQTNAEPLDIDLTLSAVDNTNKGNYILKLSYDNNKGHKFKKYFANITEIGQFLSTPTLLSLGQGKLKLNKYEGDVSNLKQITSNTTVITDEKEITANKIYYSPNKIKLKNFSFWSAISNSKNIRHLTLSVDIKPNKTKTDANETTYYISITDEEKNELHKPNNFYKSPDELKENEFTDNIVYVLKQEGRDIKIARLSKTNNEKIDTAKEIKGTDLKDYSTLKSKEGLTIFYKKDEFIINSPT